MTEGGAYNLKTQWPEGEKTRLNRCKGRLSLGTGQKIAENQKFNRNADPENAAPLITKGEPQTPVHHRITTSPKKKTSERGPARVGVPQNTVTCL